MFAQEVLLSYVRKWWSSSHMIHPDVRVGDHTLSAVLTAQLTLQTIFKLRIFKFWGLEERKQEERS